MRKALGAHKQLKQYSHGGHINGCYEPVAFLLAVSPRHNRCNKKTCAKRAVAKRWAEEKEHVLLAKRVQTAFLIQFIDITILFSFVYKTTFLHAQF